MTALAILIAAGVLTYALRSSMVHLLHGRDLSAALVHGILERFPLGLAL